ERLPVMLAVLSMALGISAATVALSIVDTTLLHPLPYPAPQEIVDLSYVDRNFGLSRAFTYRFFYDSVGRLPGIGAISPLSFSDLILDDADQAKSDPVVVTGLACSTSLFDLLQLEPLRGRLFDQKEEAPGTGRSVALIGEELWRVRYGADPNILGRTIRVNEQPFTVIGVMIAGLRLPPIHVAPAVWITLGSD